ncbi:hypothetical protein [Burkholderia pseudomallei]|uniref:hypothetical protein n=1 Tax=Burkholderia pseudomallei TaxID=28450 RepID=UPI00050EC190|nr:hypothetical protein [Burkholderia pseudomallei]KGC67998.1 hypothetical protein DP57_2332 [Burkholderia pseudomallei]KGS05556.1 hypothetical protein X977_728 [Burkholderia pseudomallei MSHR7504]MBO7768636.1 hypothetical protein [Burkholderia pseudomallei]MBO7824798.1 hypothetical protein [Burkholderia pseudomallei]MBO7881059.1 hypothetical protein [Burkholderia pseudomallei]
MEKVVGRYVAIVGIAIFGALAYEYVPWGSLQQSERASWVQAVGSVVGILIAVAVPAWQHAEAQKRARIDAAAKFRAVVKVVQLGCARVTNVWDQMNKADVGYTYFANLYDATEFEHIDRLLGTVEVHSLPTPAAVDSYVSAHQEYNNCVGLIASAFSEHGNPRGNLDYICEQLDLRHARLVSEVNKLLNECHVIERGHERWSRWIREINELR